MVDAEDKRRARLNCIAHLLIRIPYSQVDEARLKLPKRMKDDGYRRPPRDLYTYVPDYASTLLGPEPGSAGHAAPHGGGQLAHHGEDPPQHRRGVDDVGAGLDALDHGGGHGRRGWWRTGPGSIPSVIRPTTKPGRTMVSPTPVPTSESPRPWEKASRPDLVEP